MTPTRRGYAGCTAHPANVLHCLRLDDISATGPVGTSPPYVQVDVGDRRNLCLLTYNGAAELARMHPARPSTMPAPRGWSRTTATRRC